MASMTAAERQARRRRTASTDNKARINLYVDLGTRQALARVARREGVTQSQVLERLIRQAESEATATMSDADLDDYLATR